MKKTCNYLLQVVLFSFALIILLSCSKQVNTIDYVPKDATFVLTIELKNLSEKGKFNEFKTTNTHNLLRKLITSGEPKFEKIYDQFIENPSGTGIDFKKELFVYNTLENKNTVIMIPLASSEKFENFVSGLKKDLSLPIEIKKDKEISMISFGKNSSLGWNSSFIILLRANDEIAHKDNESTLINLFTPNFENSIFKHADFKAFYAEKKDINFWMSSSLISDSVIRLSLEKSLGVDLKDNYFHAYLDFAKEDINIYGNIAMSEEIKKKYDSKDMLKDGISENMLQLLPVDKVLGALSFAIKPDKYLEYINKSDSTSLSSFQSLLKQWINEDILGLLKFLGGDILLTFNGIEKTVVESKLPENSKKGGYPLFTLLLSINDSSQLENLVTTLFKKELKKNGSDFIMDMDNFSILFAINNNNLIITDDQECYSYFKDQSGKESMAKSPLAVKFKTSPTFFYLNLNYDSYPEDMKVLIRNMFEFLGGFEKYKSLIDIYDYFSVETTKDNKALVKIHLRNSNENSLFTIFHNIDQFLGKI